MLLFFLTCALAQEDCPMSLYCSETNEVARCGDYCGRVGSWSILRRACSCRNGACSTVPSSCNCDGVPNPSYCVIPAYDVCMNPATTASQCEVQARSGSYSFSFTNGISTCNALNCPALSTTDEDPRVASPTTLAPTNLPPTNRPPTIRVTAVPTMRTTTTTPTMLPVEHTETPTTHVSSVHPRFDFFLLFLFNFVCFRFTGLFYLLSIATLLMIL